MISMRLFKNIVFLFIIIILSSCSVLKEKTPQYTLLKIYQHAEKKEFDKIKKYIYGINYISKDGSVKFNSAEQFIKGVKENLITGNFAYHKRGILFHSNFVNIYSYKTNKELIDKFIIKNNIHNCDEYINKVINEKPDDLVFYVTTFTTLVFIKKDGLYKILLSVNLTDVEEIPKNYK